MADGFRYRMLSLITAVILSVAGMAVIAVPAVGQDPLLSVDPGWSSVHTNATTGVALGDVDGDGDIDLVCGNHGQSGQSNTLYLNEAGILSTAPAWMSPLQNRTRAVALGDIDGDGDLDLVCGNWQGTNALYLNEGGTFSASMIWESDSLHTSCLALGDVDGDRDLDLVCGTDGEGSRLYLNEGGAFVEAWSSEVAYYAEDLALADVDGDGAPDLVFANYRQSNVLYLNEGGTFGLTPAWSSGPVNPTTSIDLGDVDGDGDLDLVCGCGEQSNVLYLNVGGVFSVDPVWFSGPAGATHDIALGDVDGDGDLDLFCGNYAQPNTVYLNSDGVLSSDPAWSSQGGGPTLSVAPCDIDADGDLDLVCGNAGYPALSNTIYMNQSMEIETTPFWTSAPRKPTYAVALGDIDDDDDLDLVCGSYGYSNTMFLNQDGLLSRNPAWSSAPSLKTCGIALADIDGGGDLDLACGNWGENNTVYANSGGILSALPAWESDSAAMTASVALGDVDGDGDLDLVCGNAGDAGQSNELYLNDGAGLSTTPAWASGPAHQTVSIALGDVDGDGDLDLVCGNRGDLAQSNTLYLNEDGFFSQTPAWLSGPENHTMSVALGDVDGDGDLDLVCGNDGQGNVSYSNEDGVLAASPFWSSGPANHTQGVALGDIDGDGDLDLVCGNGHGSNTLYLNESGAFSETPSWLSGPANDTRSLALGDLDGDGDLDLVCGNSAENTVYRGTRNPVFRGDPENPANQLINNSAFLSSVSVSKKHINTYGISVDAIDVESDPVWIVPEYQFEGVAVWYPASIAGYGGKIGPLETSPQGENYMFDWDVSLLPFDDRNVVLRMRAVSNPLRGGSVQHIPSYNKKIGPVEPQRPQIASSSDLLSFPTLTVGDTASLHVRISNAGNEPLTIMSIDPPSGEIRCDLTTPHTVDPRDSVDLGVFLEPRSGEAVSGNLLIASNDPVNPLDSIRIETDVRGLDIECRLLTSVPEVPLGEALTVIVTPAPDVNVERGFLYHRPCMTESFGDSIPLARSADDFIAVIPGGGVTEAGLEYYIKVENSGVFATDPAGAPDDSVFTQSVASPGAIAVTPHPNSGPDFLEGRDITVLVSLQDGTEFIEGTLHLRVGGRTAYRALPLQKTELLPTVIIPDSLVGARGLEYWVDVRTLTATLTYPADSPQRCPAVIQVTVADLSEQETFTANHYRMISIPLDFGADFAGTLEALLSDQEAFGPYDPVHWRSFRYLPSLGDYVELSGESSGEFRPVPGKAFWLICSSPNRMSTAPVPGLSTPTDSAYSMVLEVGWNQIGNPFAFPVAWNSAMVGTLTMAEAESVIVEPPVRWEIGAGYGYGVEVLETFEGYWVKNLTGEPVVLRIPPIDARAAPAQPGTAVLPVTSTSPGSATVSVSPAGDRGWRIEIGVSCAGAVDFSNAVGIEPGALTGWDRHDRSEPPMSPGRAVALYFPHRLWSRQPGDYTADIRGAYETTRVGQSRLLGGGECWGQEWHFDIAKSFAGQGSGDMALLEFGGLEGVPSGAGACLVDRALGTVTDLEDTRNYSFHLGKKAGVSEENARFVLLVGSEEFIVRYRDELPGIPARTVLHLNYPNPFNGSTIIRYDLARSDEVSLKIFDAGGALVRVLYQGRCGPGRYDLAWYGDAEGGRRAAAGIYFCRLKTASGFEQTRKILIVR